MSETNLVRFDWAIKHLLRNKADFVVLEGFLSELLKTDVTIDSILESESNAQDCDDKTNRMDLFAKLKDGENVIIEVQCIGQWDFLSRMLYGVSKVVIEHLKKGDPYGKIPRIISVNIVYFNLGEGEDYIYHGRTEFKGIHKHDTLKLGERERQMYPPSIKDVSMVYPEYFVMKVDQFRDSIKDKLDEWMYFLKNSAIKPEFNAKGIQDAAQKLAILQLSETERKRYERYTESLRNEISLVQTQYAIKKTIQETEARIIKKMHAAGMSVTEIAKIISFSEADIEKMLRFSTDSN